MKIRVLKETDKKIILKFPDVDIPIAVSKRYYKKLQKSSKCEIVEIKQKSVAS